jgi:capsular polysaccharide biosynthesis protein
MEETMEELDLKQLLNMFWTRKAQIILITLLFILVGVFYTLFMVTPKYKASTSLVLAKVEDSSTTDASITQTEVTLNQKLIATYSEIVKSKAVLSQVIENLNLSNVSEEYLRKNVKVDAVKNTEFMQITVTHENSNYVDMIANEIANVFTEKVTELYSISNVQIVDKAEAAEEPYNISHVRDIAIFIAIGMVISIMYVVIANMIDNTVKTSEGIEKDAGLLVLATIPRYNFNGTNKGGNK